MRYLFSIFLVSFSLLVFSQKKQPNVLFFLVDDLGWNDIGTHGSKLFETPAIDALANESMYFSNAYAAYPRCVPSRYAMMSGQHPARNGQKDGATLPTEVVTIAEAMKPAGYKTFYAGKWHLGHNEETWPQNQGFDVNKGGCDAGAPASYFFPYHDTGKSKNNKPYSGLETGVAGEYITDRLTDETIRFIEENNPLKTGKPFLAYLAHYAVHTPLQAKPERVKYYNEKIKKMTFEGDPYIIGPDGRAKMWQDNAVYAAMVESMDESLGKVIAKLKELGIYDNTIIIFTSDNGGLSNTGKNNKRELATTNKPLRAGKGHIYEGGIREPVFVRWPGVTNKKAATAIPLIGMDYYPSILEMCGLPLQPQNHLDGVSFAPALKGKTMDKNRPLYWHQVAARPDQTGDNNSSVIRIGNYKLHHFLDDDRIELYDLKSDPYETRNIALSDPKRVKELKNKLDNWKKEIGAAQVKEKKTKTKSSPGTESEKEMVDD
jgi:arylsulfatase A-like enzyme